LSAASAASRSARADLDAADAALKVADGRYQDSLEEVRNRQAVLEQRRTELELARQALRDSSLTSPLDGIVRERHVTVGQYVAAGSPVVTVVRMHPLRLRAAVPEREAHSVRVGQPVRLTVEGSTTVHEARVARVSPAIDETTRTLMVEAEVPNPRSVLRPGSFANAEIVTAARRMAISVPLSAVLDDGGKSVVFVADGNQYKKTEVELGLKSEDRVEIISGLKAGDHVVVKGNYLLMQQGSGE